MTELRRFVGLSVLFAAAALLCGCSDSAPSSGAGTGVSLNRAELRYAQAVNLRTGDVPGLTPRPPIGLMVRGWLGSVATCDPAAHAIEDAKGVTSARFSSIHEQGGVIGLDPSEHVHSTVYPRVNAANARRALQAALSARGRACLRRSFSGSESQEEDGSRRALFADVRVSAMHVAMSRVHVYGLRTTAKVALGPGARSSNFEDFLAFVNGSSVVTLTASGDPRPVASATERGLLLKLYGRAQDGS